ncbi:ketopantoate reductase family protein [Chloroflexota bacterium]
MDKKIAVLGVGGIGSSIGADLTKAGHNVMLVDQWPAHVEAMKVRGLHVVMPKEEFQIPVQALHHCDLCSLKQQFDIVFLAAKSYDTRWMVELIKPYLKSDGVLVSTQNSLNDEWITPIISKERDVACAFELSAEVFEPGLVKRNIGRKAARFVLGELDGGMTPRVQELAHILSAVGRTEVSTNIWGAKWTKLVFNTMNSALGAIGGFRASARIGDSRYVGFCIKLGREAVQVAAALGRILEPVFGLTPEGFINSTDETLKGLLMKINTDVSPEARSHVLQDFLKGRRTEIDYINGLIVERGREVNVPTPFNEIITSLVRQIEQGKVEPSPSTLEKLLDQCM